MKKRRAEVEWEIENNFILIEAEKLSASDDFMKWEPKTGSEEAIKHLINRAIDAKVKNFYHPKFAPAFVYERYYYPEDDSSIDKPIDICYKAGLEPASGEDYSWWKDKAASYYPERNSRIGTMLEYGAFLGVLMKKLVEDGKSLEWVWNAICNDRRELNQYGTLDEVDKSEKCTGSICVCGFYDLNIPYKFLTADHCGFYVAGGLAFGICYYGPVPFSNFPSCFNGLRISTGWVILS